MERSVNGAPVARRIVIFLMCVTAAASVHAQAIASNDSVSTAGIGREIDWPRTVHTGGTTLTVYAPQVDAWDGFNLAVRVAVKVARDGYPLYGVVALDARTLTDRSARVVSVERVRVKDAHFSGVSSDVARRWTDALIRDFSGPGRMMAFDRLVASLAATELSVTYGPALDTTPPRIIVATSPTVLVTIDGEPAYRHLAGSGFDRVVNTSALVLRGASGRHYLRIINGWMVAATIDGSWSALQPSKDVQTALDEARSAARAARVANELVAQTIPGETALRDWRPPTVRVVTTPTELIVTDGAPNWTPIPDRRAFYLLNTTGRVLKSGQDLKVYALLAGRWYRAESLRGPWSYVAASKLPSDFSHIPDRSPIENVEASIAGTPAAREAAISATIAQTVAISASASHLSTPHFDGAPAFRPIEGTSLQYVANTPTPIIRLADNGPLYAVENGVWFTAPSIDGPWSAATSLPHEFALIPPSSPLYFTTFAHIFAAEGDTVYVGYTPGYEGQFVDPVAQVVVNGTGHTYRSWLDRGWIPTPATYGLGANLTFTPWTGWRIAFGLGSAWNGDVLATGWPLAPYPWWSPWSWGWTYGADEFPWHPGWGSEREAVASWPAGWLVYAGDIYKTWNNRGLLRRANDVEPWTANAWARRVGISYNSHTLIASSGQRGALENLLDNRAIRARQVAVTPNGRLVAARNNWGLLETDSVVHHARVWDIPEAYRTARITESVDSQTAAGSLAADIGAPDLYAGPGRSVYRRTGSIWEQYTADGWRAVHDGEALARAHRMRELGETRVRTLRDASLHLWELTNR